MEIEYLSGVDVREPVDEGRKIKIIGHVCNSLGVMGSGVAKALFDKWPQVRSKYIKWSKANDHLGQNFELGKTQLVFVEEDVIVANIIGQLGVGPEKDGSPPVRYFALREGCNYIRRACQHYDATAHFPYLMGCDLAGGKWEEVEKIIKEELIDHNVSTYVYDLFNKRG
jgi:hypothetical protein